MKVTVFEKEEKMGGVVRNVIPGFRISDEAIDNDVKIVAAMGVELVTGKEITSVDELKKEYDYVVLAVGASDKGILKLEEMCIRDSWRSIPQQRLPGNQRLPVRKCGLGAHSRIPLTARRPPWPWCRSPA